MPLRSYPRPQPRPRKRGTPHAVGLDAVGSHAARSRFAGRAPWLGRMVFAMFLGQRGPKWRGAERCAHKLRKACYSQKFSE